MIWLQISSGRGPVECERFVFLLVDKISRDLQKSGISVSCLAMESGLAKDTAKSALLSIEAEPGQLKSWSGVVQWIQQSPYRSNHRRKNWFAGIWLLEPPVLEKVNCNEFKFETCRASGPGGQHVNKTNSAVRVIHLATGLYASAQEERSQHQNRQLALTRLLNKLEERQAEKLDKSRQNIWNNHNQLERGNPVKVFKGLKLQEIT